MSARTEANRRNALRSTGPRTPEGKRVSARNALRHGLAGRGVLLPDEPLEDFAGFRDGLLEALAPEGELEGLLAERVVANAWRLRRAVRVEASTLARLILRGRAEQAGSEVLALEESDLEDSLKRLRGDVRVTDPARHAEASRRQAQAREATKADELLAGSAFTERADTLAALSRYETALERGLFRALHELERRQAVRRGERVPPPAALDVDLSLGAGG